MIHGFLLDTNVLSEPIRRDPDPSLVEKLGLHQGLLATATVVWHELVYGARRLPPSARRSLLERYLAEVVAVSVVILDYDLAAAEWHARERARLTAEGLVPSFADGQIAAIAAVNDRTLVTNNVKDFEPFEGIRVERWHRGPT